MDEALNSISPNGLSALHAAARRANDPEVAKRAERDSRKRVVHADGLANLVDRLRNR